jgi:hypothetical protein
MPGAAAWTLRFSAVRNLSQNPEMDTRVLAALRQDLARIEELISFPTDHFAWKEIQARALSVHRAAAAIPAAEQAAYLRFAIDDALRAGSAAGEHYRERLQHHLALLKKMLPGAAEPPAN